MQEYPLADPEIRQRIVEIQLEHRALDDMLDTIQAEAPASMDQIQLKRLKKRKLFLKDELEKLKSLLIPDLDA